jgi:uncharacterized DUF497 family protein
MRYTFAFDAEKSALLKEERGIGFEEIIALIESDKLLGILAHPNQKKYSHQFIAEVDVEGYIYIVPFVMNGTQIFLKTIYPSRKMTKKYRSKENDKES